MIDIIIPVYNGYTLLKNCLESVFEHTNTAYRIILINDKSKEYQLINYLHELKAIKNLVIINNKKNLGFVQSVNKGVKLSKNNDVVLLNSDTLVTRNWLKKLKNCAYSCELVATVTPLSNNATFCSVPNFEINNDIPDGFTINSFASLIEEKSLVLYPEIPTGVGFCMYIKREALNSIGYFDEKYFGKGYGEENDFCMRAKKAGFINILDDSTFVYHKGSGSFTDNEKYHLQKRNLKIMDKLHPEYFSTISQFYLENPLKPVLENISFWLENYNLKKKNILFVKHFEPSVGGVGINLQQIINSTTKFNFYVFSLTATGNISLSNWRFGKEIGVWEFNLDRRSKFNNVEREIENLFEKIINYFKIDLVHFQHLRGFPLSLMKIPKQFNIPSVISLHDYFLISSSPDLQQIDKLGRPFFFKKPIDYIKYLLNKNKTSKKTEIDIFRFRRVVELLHNINIAIAPSKFVKYQFKKIFADMSIIIIEHGTDLPKNQEIIFKTKEQLTIAFLGAGALNKGITDFIKLSQDKRLKGKFIWKTIGGVDYKLIDDLGLSQNLSNLKNVGPYKINELQKILNKEDIDLVIILSNTPETYSYTLSESIQSNIPVIGRNIGALSERIKKMEAGWTFNDYEDAVLLLVNLFQNQDLINIKRKQLQDKEIYHSSEMTQLYTNLYNQLMTYQKNKIYNISDKKAENNRFFYHNIVYTNIYNKPHKKLFSQIKMFVRSIPIVGSPVLILARRIKISLLQI